MTTSSPSTTDAPSADVSVSSVWIPARWLTNLLLLVGLILIILNGWYLYDIGPKFLTGILVEILLAILTLLFIKMEALPVREVLRWRWPGWGAIGLSVVVGAGFWMIGIVVNLLSMVIFGYSTPVSPAAYPGNGLEVLLFATATVIAAPICEEILFRGYVQRAYGARRRWVGWVIAAIIFAMYHLRFQGALPLLPVALVLGYVAWRNDALLPSIIVHAVYNGFSTLVMAGLILLPFEPFLILVIAMVVFGLILAPLALAALWWMRRTTQPPTPDLRRRDWGWVRRTWPLPLAVMLLIYGYVATTEYIVGRHPERLAEAQVELDAPAAWDTPTRWRYEIRNMLDEPIGEATCELTPAPTHFDLACRAAYDAFDIAADLPVDLSAWDIDLSRFDLALTGEATAWHQQARWSRPDLQLEALEGGYQVGEERATYSLASGELRIGGRVVSDTVASEALFAREWPWRMTALPFEIAYGARHPLLSVTSEGEYQSRARYVMVRDGEPVWTVDENVLAWRVTVAEEGAADGASALSAWYDAEPPHTLVRYDDGAVTYVLEEIVTGEEAVSPDEETCIQPGILLGGLTGVTR